MGIVKDLVDVGKIVVKRKVDDTISSGKKKIKKAAVSAGLRTVKNKFKPKKVNKPNY